MLRSAMASFQALRPMRAALLASGPPKAKRKMPEPRSGNLESATKLQRWRHDSAACDWLKKNNALDVGSWDALLFAPRGMLDDASAAGAALRP